MTRRGSRVDKMGAVMNGDDKDAVDTVYAGRRPRVDDFVFDRQVAAVFPDMIARSVPGYQLVAALTGIIAARHARPGCNIYDLGCSTGAALLSAHARIGDASVKFIGVDNAAPMLERCRANLDGVIDSERLGLVHGDVRDARIENADAVILNFTLQFLAPDDRLGLLRRIHAGMNTGGALIIAEKVKFDDPAEARLQQALHEDFKAANGYSDLEIAQKRAALEHVLVPDSAPAHLARLELAGFAQVTQWFQAFNFCAFLARK